MTEGFIRHGDDYTSMHVDGEAGEPPHRRGGPTTTRRRLLGAIAGGALGGLAGCAIGPNEVTSSTEVFGHPFTWLPEEAQLNPWSTNYPFGFAPLLFESLSITTPGEGSRPGRLVDSLDVDGSTVTVGFEEGYSWWSGDAVTARDLWVKHRIEALRTGGEPRVALRDEYTLEYDLERALARPLVLSKQLGGTLNTAAWVFEPWMERFEDVSTKRRREKLNERLRSMTIDLEEAARRGYGCGPYEFSEVSSNRLLFRRFDEHPRVDRITVPRLWFPAIRQKRVDDLIKRGWLDGGTGKLSDRGITVPDHLEQLATYPVLTGWKLALNWTNPHLSRMNVRRAIAAALPIETIVESSGWGRADGLQTGLTRPAERRWLDADLRESLYRYPVASDEELAASFMREAGYERRGDRWIAPGGTRVALDLLVPTGNASAGNLIGQALDSFGFVVSVEQQSPASFVAVAQNRNYDLLPWGTGGDPYSVYDVTVDDGAALTYGIADPAAENAPTARPIRPRIPSDPSDLHGDPESRVDLLKEWERIRRPPTDRETREAIARFARWWNYGVPDVDLSTVTMSVWGNTRDFTWPDGRPLRTYGPDRNPVLHLLKTGAIGRSD